jgi:hypothetical protein
LISIELDVVIGPEISATVPVTVKEAIVSSSVPPSAARAADRIGPASCG